MSFSHLSIALLVCSSFFPFKHHLTSARCIVSKEIGQHILPPPGQRSRKSVHPYQHVSINLSIQCYIYFHCSVRDLSRSHWVGPP